MGQCMQSTISWKASLGSTKCWEFVGLVVRGVSNLLRPSSDLRLSSGFKTAGWHDDRWSRQPQHWSHAGLTLHRGLGLPSFFSHIYILISPGINTDICIFIDIRFSHVLFLLVGASYIMIWLVSGVCFACRFTVRVNYWRSYIFSGTPIRRRICWISSVVAGALMFCSGTRVFFLFPIS